MGHSRSQTQDALLHLDLLPVDERNVHYLRAGRSARKPCSSNSSGRGITAERNKQNLRTDKATVLTLNRLLVSYMPCFGLFTDYNLRKFGENLHQF